MDTGTRTSLLWRCTQQPHGMRLAQPLCHLSGGAAPTAGNANLWRCTQQPQRMTRSQTPEQTPMVTSPGRTAQKHILPAPTAGNAALWRCTQQPHRLTSPEPEHTPMVTSTGRTAQKHILPAPAAGNAALWRCTQQPHRLTLARTRAYTNGHQHWQDSTKTHTTCTCSR